MELCGSPPPPTGVARCSKASVLPWNEWIPQPLPHLSEALPPSCTTLEGRIQRKCGVTFATVPADASAPTPAIHGDLESGRLLSIWVVLWVRRYTYMIIYCNQIERRSLAVH